MKKVCVLWFSLAIFLITPYHVSAFFDGKLFLEIFPTLRMATRNFKNEPIDQLSYLDYHNSPRLLNLGVDLAYQGLHLYLALDIFRELTSDSNNFGFSNIPITPHGLANSVNNNWPTTAYVEYTHEIFEVSLGRRRFGMGYGDYGMNISPTAPYFDGLWVGLKPKVGPGKLFYYFVAFADNHLANRQYLQKNQALWDEAHPAPPEGTTNPFIYETNTKWYFNHKIGYAWQNGRIGISESSVIYGTPVTFWNANPFTFWHNTYEKGMNVTLGLSGEGFVGDVRMYGELLMDDFKLGLEGAGANPTSFGAYFGVDWNVLKGDVYSGYLFGNKEQAKREESFAYTGGGLLLSWQLIYGSTYLYGRNARDPFGKFTMMHNMRGMEEDKVMEYFIGSPYGPDSFVMEFSAKYQTPQWYFRGRTALQFQGSKGYDGFYSDATGWAAQGLYGDDTNDWLFSELKNVNLYLYLEMYYAFHEYFSYYASFNNRIVLNNAKESRSQLETGIAMRF